MPCLSQVELFAQFISSIPPSKHVDRSERYTCIWEVFCSRISRTLLHFVFYPGSADRMEGAGTVRGVGARIDGGGKGAVRGGGPEKRPLEPRTFEESPRFLRGFPSWLSPFDLRPLLPEESFTNL